MVTQLQDVANTVAKEKISSDRLRNEEIRRSMSKPWSEPTEVSGASPSTLQSTSTTASGTAPTMASTYNTLKSNFQNLGLDDTSDSRANSSTANDSYGSTTNWKTQGWAPGVVGFGANLLGAGNYSGLASAATSLMQGNKVGATANLASTITNLLNKGSVPGLPSAVGTLTAGVLGDKSASEIGQSLFNSGLGTVLGMANPVAGIGYSLARMLGVDPARGLASLFDTTDYATEGGHAGGLITPQSDYTGYTPGQAYEPGSSNLTPVVTGITPDSEYSGYSPGMYDSTTGSYGVGNLSDMYSGVSTGSSGNTSGYSPGTYHYGYSNPAASYGGWTSSSDSGSE